MIRELEKCEKFPNMKEKGESFKDIFMNVLSLLVESSFSSLELKLAEKKIIDERSEQVENDLKVLKILSNIQKLLLAKFKFK